MKIVFIGQKGIGHIPGGVEKHVEALSVRLAKKGHTPIVYARGHFYENKRPFFDGVAIVYLSTLPTKHFDAIVHTFLAIVHTFLYHRDAHVIHFHSIGPASLLWLMRLLKPRTPVIATMHAKCYDHSKWGIFARLYLYFSEWACCTFAQEIIVISQDLKNYVDTRYNKHAHYIPNGAPIELEIPKKDALDQWHLQEGGYFLFVGRLIPGKKVDVLIEAYKKLHTDKKLVIVGGSAHTDKHVKNLYREAKDCESIIFAGYQNSQIVHALMVYAHAFVFPSESEGMSLVLLEAMAAKTPIIVSDIDGNRTLLDNSECTYTFVGDAENLSQAMRESIIYKEKFDEKVGRAYNKVLNAFSWDHILEETIMLYKNILKKK